MGISIDYDVINIINNPDYQDPDHQDPDHQDPDLHSYHQNTISYDQFIRFLCIMSAIYPTQLN
jgi:hypothetical protein